MAVEMTNTVVNVRQMLDGRLSSSAQSIGQTRAGLVIVAGNACSKFTDGRLLLARGDGRRLSTFLPSASRQKMSARRPFLVHAAASFSSSSADEDPYSVLGVNPLSGFDAVKVAHRKKTKEADARGDEAALERLNKAYDSIMMRQLTMRKKGVTFGSLKVSSDIKFADRQSAIPWKPRLAKVKDDDVKINAAVSIILSLWAVVAVSAQFQPLQLLLGFFVFRLFMKLEPYYTKSRRVSEEDEEGGGGQEETKNKWDSNGGRLLRCLGLAFSCVALSSLVHTLLVAGLSVLGFFVPLELFKYQEVFLTLCTAWSLFYTASYLR